MYCQTTPEILEFHKARMKPYCSAEQQLVFDWCEKWLELIDLINEVTGTCEPPTVIDELRYQRLRFWFIEHDAQFMPLWKDFCEFQERTSHQNSDSKDITYLKDAERYIENPFSLFYESENLYRLAQQLDLQCGIDTWEPNEYRTSTIRPIMIRIGEKAIQFADWVSERACNPR